MRPERVTPQYQYSYGRQNWFGYSASEHLAVREGVGLFDQSSFAKFRVEGRDASGVLNYVCANDIDVTAGRLVYTQWLNDKGGIEADLTVTRFSDNAFLIVTAAETEVRDYHWLKGRTPADAHCILTNVTSGMRIISIMGPEITRLIARFDPVGCVQRCTSIRVKPGD
jgi:4-methylaminobutanoate oxidase (formaldehyde-forming)